MNQTNEHAVRSQDVIELGVASVETKGPGNATEGQGQLVEEGISLE